eukprot:810380-Prorocentrum_minimum.AAC.1
MAAVNDDVKINMLDMPASNGYARVDGKEGAAPKADHDSEEEMQSLAMRRSASEQVCIQAKRTNNVRLYTVNVLCARVWSRVNKLVGKCQQT